MVLPKGIGDRTNKAIKTIDWLEGRFKQWGEPKFDYRSEIFWEMVFDIIKVWEKMWPQEKVDWEHDRKVDLRDERSLRESVRGGFKKSVAYPPHLFQMLKQYWPTGSLSSKNFTQSFMGRFPIFRNSNYT